MTRARTLADMISDGVIGTTELADDAITPVKLDETGNYTIAQLGVNGTLTSDGLTVDLGNTTDVTLNGTDGGGIQFNYGGVNQVRIDSTSNDGGVYHTPTGKNHTFKTDGANRLKIATGGDISFYEDTGTTAKFFWDASAESLGIGTSSPQNTLDLSSTSPQIRLSDTNATGYSKISGSAGNIYLQADEGNTVASSKIDFRVDGAQRMVIDASGNVLVGKSSAAAAGAGLWMYKSGTSYGRINFGTSITGTSFPAVFYNNSGSEAGSITYTTSSTSYNTSSDYRLKTDAQPMTGASARVLALNPVNFQWIADGTRVDGFLAHEAQAVVPEAVTGTKDAMMDEEYEVTPAVLDDDGNETKSAVMGTRSVPDMQGIDQSKLVPLLVAALQDALARITALENA